MAKLAKVISLDTVSLSILDSSVCHKSIVIIDCVGHGPEIACLTSGKNGLLTSSSLDSYVSGVFELLSGSVKAERLKGGCKISASKYTIENMVRKFADGLTRCIELPVYSGRRE